MTEQEAFEALKNGRPVSAKRLISLDWHTFSFRCIQEIQYAKDKQGNIKCYAQLLDRRANSVTAVPVEDVEYML